MDRFELVVPTLFGLEAFTSKEIRRLGYETTITDGRVTFMGDCEAICRSNVWLRTGERILIKVGQFKAESFEELFENTYALDWGLWLAKDSAFPVKGYSLKSKLASVRDCQAIIKKAIAKKMSNNYGVEWFPEDGTLYQIQFSIYKDEVLLMIDTSGEPLHKRGYRQNSNLAPLRETIAAAMVMMSFWKYEYPLCDPFCGSGTIPIEAAMIKKNIAPGLNRRFAASYFSQIDSKLWDAAVDEAKSMIKDVPLDIYASDIDLKTVELARENAQKAGVGKYIKVSQKNAASISFDEKYGTVICNPPYGERLGEIKECEELYRRIGKNFKNLYEWNYYILTSNEDFERHFGRVANKKRKIYNGMLKCNIYQYYGAKPQQKKGVLKNSR